MIKTYILLLSLAQSKGCHCCIASGAAQGTATMTTCSHRVVTASGPFHIDSVVLASTPRGGAKSPLIPQLPGTHSPTCISSAFFLLNAPPCPYRRYRETHPGPLEGDGVELHYARTWPLRSAGDLSLGNDLDTGIKWLNSIVCVIREERLDYHRTFWT